MSASEGRSLGEKAITEGKVLMGNPDFQPWLVERMRLFATVNTFDAASRITCLESTRLRHCFMSLATTNR